MDAIFPALLTLLSPTHLSFLLLGVVLGLVVGLLPGLGGIAGMSLVLPFVFGMDPGLALAMMVGLTAVTTTSDTFPSVLMGIPGTSGSQATVMDGYPLAKQGQAARALAAAFSASLVGGVFGALVLTFAIFVAQPIIFAIGLGEQLMLVLLALSMVGMLTGASVLKGLAGCGLGLLVGAIGAAPATAEPRLGFDTVYLSDGVPLVIVGLGMFAVPEIIDVLRRQQMISETGKLGTGWLEGLKDMFRHYGLVLRCAGIGSLVGALPGLGGTVVDWIAYGHVIQTSPDRDNFGKGDIRGVLAPESANNAKEGGALFPTLLFGIPGSGSMALLLGGLVLIGIEPGPDMAGKDLDLTFLVIWSIALANIFGAGICLALARPIARLTTIRYTLIAPFMFCIILFAAYQATRDWGDLIGLLVFGTLGVYMKRFGWSRAALLIGYVLSVRLEESFYQTIQVYGLSFLGRPIAAFLLALTVLSVYFALRGRARHTSSDGINPEALHHRRPQIVFLVVPMAFVVVMLVDSWNLTYLAGFYPKVMAGITGSLILGILASLVLRKQPHADFWDEELPTPGTPPPLVGTLHYLLWILALLVGSVAIGFVLAVAVFMFVFLRVKGKATYLSSALGSAAVVALLAVLGHFLTLEYARGYLQDYLPLPWPFI